jgi:hypothetical protein
MANVRPGSKRVVAVEILNANNDKPMAEVISLFAAAYGINDKASHSYYVWLFENCPDGVVNRGSEMPAAPARAAKPVTLAEPKAEKPKKPKTGAKSADEVEAIKAANLKRLKEVHSRYKQNVKKQEADEVIEADPFGSPAALSAEEVRALV